MKKRISDYVLWIPILLFISGVVTTASAQSPGDLLVTPTRALFEDGKRNEVLTLINRGSDTATYRISMIQYRMTVEGDLERIEEPDSGQAFATDLIRFFPRQVTIAPGETQNVRVQVRLPQGLKDGEYRSHMYFRSVPKQEALTVAEEDSLESSSEFSVKITAVYGVSIPVIVRQGQVEAEVSVQDLALDTLESDGRPALSMTFRRDGDESVYGAVRAGLQLEDGRIVPVGGIGGVAVYTPNTERRFHLPLNLPEDITLDQGTLVVTYESQSDSASEILAKGTLAVK